MLRGEAYFQNHSVALFYNTNSKNKVLRCMTAIMSPSYSEKMPKVLAPKDNNIFFKRTARLEYKKIKGERAPF